MSSVPPVRSVSWAVLQTSLHARSKSNARVNARARHYLRIFRHFKAFVCHHCRLHIGGKGANKKQEHKLLNILCEKNYNTINILSVPRDTIKMHRLVHLKLFNIYNICNNLHISKIPPTTIIIVFEKPKQLCFERSAFCSQIFSYVFQVKLKTELFSDTLFELLFW